MSKKLIVGLGFLCILVITTGFSCKTTPFKAVTIPVKINAGCSVPDVTIKPDGQVSWTAVVETNGIMFPNTKPPNPPPYSPFKQMAPGQSYPVSVGPPLPSGPVRDDVKATCSQDNPPPGSCRFKYNVTGGPTPGCPNDPVVIIHP